MKLDKIIDIFVEKINQSDKDLLEEDELPPFLRLGEPDEYGDYSWIICEKDCKSWIDPLVAKLPKRFPPSYYSLVSRYAFPVLEVGPVMLFANTGEDSYWELSKRIFIDKYMSTMLLKNGYIQFGNQYYGSYNPVCFDINRKRREHPVVLIDHAEILHKSNSKVVVMDEIAPSFMNIVKTYLEESSV